MKIINVKCPSCGNALKTQRTDEFIECEYCHTKVYLDDENKKLEISLKLNNNRENADAYLYKFKEYDKSKSLYQKLLHKTVDDKELWLGYLLSITHDFTKETYYNFEKEEIKEAWNHYSSLANNTEIKKYESKVQNTLAIIEKQIEKEKQRVEKKSKIVKLIFLLIVAAIITIIILKIINPHSIKLNGIKASEISNTCVNMDTCDLSPIIKKQISAPFSKVVIDKVLFNPQKSDYEVKINYVNKLSNKTEINKFTITDDIGPIIFVNNCETYEKVPVDFSKCIQIYDLTDGYISTNNIETDLPDIPYKAGQNKVNITIQDKDGNKTSKQITLNVLKTPIDTFKLDINNKVELNKELKFNVIIEPEDINDKTFELTYDKSLLEKINDTTFKALNTGNTEVCIKSNYDNSKKECQKITITPVCQNEYIFTFDGSKEETITTNVDFCEGTYRVYAPNVLNKSTPVYIDQHSEGSISSTNSMLIWKTAGSLNKEGSKFSLQAGTYLKIDSGILKIKLTKVK